MSGFVGCSLPLFLLLISSSTTTPLTPTNNIVTEKDPGDKATIPPLETTTSSNNVVHNESYHGTETKTEPITLTDEFTSEGIESFIVPTGSSSATNRTDPRDTIAADSTDQTTEEPQKREEDKGEEVQNTGIGEEVTSVAGENKRRTAKFSKFGAFTSSYNYSTMTVSWTSASIQFGTTPAFNSNYTYNGNNTQDKHSDEVSTISNEVENPGEDEDNDERADTAEETEDDETEVTAAPTQEEEEEPTSAGVGFDNIWGLVVRTMFISLVIVVL